jgi:hypothetical protein
LSGTTISSSPPTTASAPLLGLGEFKSRVAAVGPQIGYFFPIADAQGYINLKAYSEFAAENRPRGMNAFLSLVISPKEPEAAEPTPPLGH